MSSAPKLTPELYALNKAQEALDSCKTVQVGEQWMERSQQSFDQQKVASAQCAVRYAMQYINGKAA